ncbi:hypothetical protein [Acinetobacter oleivorans]|uniref:hypothetical protein n=1 Tax=Acinetobacter oleivorans TaxID=1148157 RepID=UPI00226CA4F1|nr:hypothetical protein [Acinetobacter oleivorans]
MNQIKKTQNDIDTLIREVDSFSALIQKEAKEYNLMYPGIGMSNPWDAEIKPNIDKFITNYQINKHLYSYKGLTKIKEDLNFIVNKLMHIHNSFESDIPVAEGVNLLNKIQEESKKTLNKFYEYGTNNELSEADLNCLLEEISKIRPDITSSINKNIYDKLNKTNKIRLSKNLVKIFNMLNNTKTNEDIEEINELISNIENIFLWVELDDKSKEIEQTITQINENSTITNITPITTGYEDECEKIIKRVDKLNTRIICLFILLIAVFIIKIISFFIIANFFDSKDTNYIYNIYSYISFISLILSISALTAYFIKDRNRLIKIHDQYKLNVLELSTLPKYMGELDRTQRRQLYIDLSHNFFRGSAPNQENNKNSNNELEGLSKSLAELSKIISNLKGTTK